MSNQKKIQLRFPSGEKEVKSPKKLSTLAKVSENGRKQDAKSKTPLFGGISLANELPEFRCLEDAERADNGGDRLMRALGLQTKRANNAESKHNMHSLHDEGEDSFAFSKSLDSLPHLKTGDDAIAFFAANREDMSDTSEAATKETNPVKFVTLNRANTGLDFRPYDLVVVPPEQANPEEHYVMSAQSILQFGTKFGEMHGGNSRATKTPASITPLPQWIHEATMFRALRNLDTFRNHLIRKAWSSWKSSVSFNKYCRTRAKLQDSLLFVQPYYSKAFLSTQQMIAGLVRNSVFEIEGKRSTPLAVFIEKQLKLIEDEILQRCIQGGETINASMVEVIDSLLKDLKTFRQNLFLAKRNNNSSKVGIMQQRIERETTEHAIERNEKLLRRLPEFTRFLNHYILGMLLTYLVDAYNNLAELSTSFANYNSGVFRVAIELRLKDTEGEGNVGPTVVAMLNPSRDNMYQSFSEACTKLLDIVDSFPLLRIQPPIVDTSDISKFHAESSSGKYSMNPGTSLTNVCAEHASLSASFQRIYDAIETSYGEGNVYGEGFRDKFHEIYFNIITFDPESYLAGTHEYGELNQLLSKYVLWEKTLHNMKLEAKCGSMLTVESRSFKELLLQRLQPCVETVKAALVKLGVVMVEELLSEYRNACTELLVNSAASLSNHSTFVENFNRHTLAKKLYEKRCDLVQDITKLQQEHHIATSIDDATQLERLWEERARFEEALVLSEHHIQEQNQSYIDKLNAAIASTEDVCNKLTSQLNKSPFTDATMDADEILEQLNSLEAAWQQQLEKAQKYKHQTEVLVGGKKKPDDKPSRTYNFESGPVANGRAMLDRRIGVWTCRSEWNGSVRKWWNTEISILLNPELNDDKLDGPTLEKQVEDYYQQAVKFNKKYKGDAVVEQMMKDMAEIRGRVSFFILFGHPSLLPRHFNEMYTRIFRTQFVDENGKVFLPEGDTPSEEPVSLDPTIVTIGNMEKLGLFDEDKHEPLEEICGTANKEYSLVKAMDKMEVDWTPVTFPMIEYKDTGTSIFKSMDEIEQILDDQLVRTQAMRASRYIRNIEGRCIAWEEKLKLLEELIKNMLAMQGTWLYLEPIFSSPDICKQMPKEAKMFKKVDKLWRDSMKGTLDDPSVLSIVRQPELLPKFIKANEMLDEIQKGLADYLNAKRVFFPRFFFLSNDELLEILSETKDPKRVQPHLIKCFEGINSLEFSNTMDINAMISTEGEVVPFPYDDVEEKVINPNEAGGCVEIWLDQIQNIMRKTVAHSFDLAMVDYAKRVRTEWICDWPGQVVLGVTQTYWTQECTKAIYGGPAEVQKYADYLSECINDIIKMVRGRIPKLVRKTVSPLVVLDVHSRDVTQELVHLGINDPNDFDWLCQLRYYWNEGRYSALTGEPGSVQCQMINAERLYGFEYLGNSMRLVVTPLTDRCYRTLMGAIHLDYGGAPAGPAGTGKTETTKDLGKAIAIQTVVYNCSDSLDYQAMGKFFKGLAGTGAWACFDEFNRINLEVLSVVAQQILTIQRAKIAKVETFEFEGEVIKLRITCNVFITMNPGYAGRQELPDNLKALFRDVAMMVPDYAMIGQIMLYSMGYLEGFKLAKKIVMTYKLCSEQLSSQPHYDYGMRAVMAVLRAAGNLKQEQPEEDENILCLRSIIDVNLPKFLAPDVPLFNGIVSDLFPGVKLPEVNYTIMDNMIREVCRDWQLDPTDYFVGKVHEVYEMMIVRHGFMVVGLPFAGKTTSLKMLQEVLTRLKDKFPDEPKWTRVHAAIINPKSIKMGQLYGEFDAVSHEWTDGVLAIAYRNFSTNPPKIGAVEDRKWVWFDGPVDAIWIENMNTVLDDNKKLCLMSGEMIMMSPTMSMIFEPMDLEVASPATVSRVGVIYMEPTRMGWHPILKSWLMKYGTLEESEDAGMALEEIEAPKAPEGGKDEEDLPGDEAPKLLFHFDNAASKLISKLFYWLVDPAICFTRRECHSFVPTLDQTLVVAMLRLMEAMFNEASEAKVDICDAMIENTFLFSLIWSIGAVLDDAGRAKFDVFLRAFMKNPNMVNEDDDLKGVLTLLMLRDWKNPLEYGTYMFNTPIPEADSVFDYCYIGGGAKRVGSAQIEKREKTWMHWNDTFVLPTLQADQEFSSIMIPTSITAQMERYLVLCIENAYPTLVVGPTGTGKSMFIAQVLAKNVDADVYKTVSIGFTAKATANQTQQIVDSKLDKRRRGIFGPQIGSKCVVFIDDFNMPEVEPYGAQPPIEIVRQLVENGGWYDLAEKEFKTIVDTQLVSAMCPPGGSRNHITPRMLRHFNILCVSSFDGTTMGHIFKTILSWHMESQNMSEEIIALCGSIIQSTLEIYQGAIENLLPTPLKSHYTFNLRDFSRVIQGILQVKGSSTIDAAFIKRLWVHETCRVFMDRLVDVQDQTWFMSTINDVLIRELDVPGGTDELLGHLNPDGSGKGNLDSFRNLFFGSYVLDEDDNNASSKYLEIDDIPSLVPMMDSYLTSYNAESKTQMDLVMFGFAIEHISRISRVLGMPRGNLLLVGVGGSGRQSLTRLASFIADYSLVQIELSKNYTEVEWRDDLQRVLKGAGVGAKPMVFLFADTQVKYESFIEDINSMLNTGEVPNLFPFDVRMDILDKMQRIAKEAGLRDVSLTELWTMFIQRVRERLHVVLAFSPIGGAFRDRLRKFPSLVNCCTIDWFFAWPADALVAVARTFLKEVSLETEVREKIVEMCQYMHLSVSELSERMKAELRRISYVTPTSYLELIRSFKSSLAARREDVSGQRSRYEIGLEKLAFAAGQVSTMQQELTDLIPVLEQSKAETNELMGEIEKKLPGVEAMKKTVGEEAEAVEKQAQVCGAMKAECESDLAEAIPMLEEAMKALDTLKPADITEVKAMKSPPAGVVLVMSAVCQMMGVKPDRIKDPNDASKKVLDYWGPAKKDLLGDPKFLQRLKDYDKDNIAESVIKILQSQYISNPDFEPSKIKQASVAAYGLCKWVRAMESYDKVVKVVAPKKLKLKETEAELNETMATLAEKQAQLKAVVDDLDSLQTHLEDAKNKKAKLEFDVDLCEKKLVRAKQLIDGLGGEKSRWTERVEKLKIEYEDLTGNVLVAAGVIAYLGVFTSEYRDSVTEKWSKLCMQKCIPCMENPTLLQTLGDPVSIRAWNINGLPTDSFSVDNAIILFNARRWPLLIDPEGQANKWIRNMETPNGLKIIKLSDPNFMRTTENAVQFGSPVLLENVGEEVDPSLEPLLQKATFKQGGVTCIRLGENVIEYSADFRFYITTKLRNPHYLPEIAVKVTLLNFMITPAGLQDQMLAKVVKAEKPELAAEKERLIVEGAENSARLRDCENRILHILSTSSGNILEDESAIDTLKSSKKIADEINEKQAAVLVTEKKIDDVRAGYVPVANHAQILYFCISDLANIEPTYQYALEWFGALFLRSIDESEPSDDLATRLQIISDHFTYSLYNNVCRSLLEKDKLLFSFLLCIRLQQGHGAIDTQEWVFLLTGGVATDNPHPNPCPGWLVEKGWGEISRLSDIPAFSGLRDDIGVYAKEFRAIYDSADAHKEPLPGPWNDKLTMFQKLLVLRAIRPDKIGLGVQDYVISQMGEKFVKPPNFNLRECFNDASYMTPLVFVLSPGADPMTALIKLSEDISARIDSISLGQGQGPKAEAMIDRAQKAQNEKIWVVLQNCHLATSWMPSLERIVEHTDVATCNRHYRLWCTTYPTPDFPVVILQNSVKLTMEPPRGLRANILGSFKADPICDQEFYNSVARNEGKEWRKLLFGLCFFHALVQERRNFGPLGWNISYEFSTSDLIISVKQLGMFLDLYSEMPYKALNYCTGQCNYGGRVTDDKDRRCLMTILGQFYQPIVLDDHHPLSASGEYRMPVDGTYDDMLQFIESMPLVNKPEVFGLNDNANITKGQQETNALFDSILLTQKADAGGGGQEEGEDAEGEAATKPKTDEDVIFEVADNILSKLPPRFDMELAELKYPVMWEQSMNTVLVQELLRFNNLVNVIEVSLIEVKKAVRGIVVMSEELEKIGTSMLFGTVPKKWLGASYPSLKPLAGYVQDLLRRLDFLQTWLDTTMPPVYWLSGFYFTQAFLTGTLQNFARKYTIPIDDVDFDFKMLTSTYESYKEPPSDGAYVYGLFVDGARFDFETETLQDSQPKVLISPAPVMHLVPAAKADIRQKRSYNCPVYKTSERRGILSTTGHSTNFVMFIRLPIPEPESDIVATSSPSSEDYWIIGGVALLTATND